jgi:spore germination protein YaaH
MYCLFLTQLIFIISVATPSRGYTQKLIEKIFYYVERQDSFEHLAAHINQIILLGPQSYKIDKDGSISGSVDIRVRELAKANDVGVIPLVVNPGFDPDIIHAVLKDHESQRRAIETMLHICKEGAFIGIQFDFEHIHVDYRDKFTQFFRQAAKTLHRNGFLISAAVFPRTGDTPAPSSYHQWYFDNSTGAFDYKALSEAADFLTIMTYDQHSEKTTPGPVSGLPWIEQVLSYLLQQIPANKISLGIPLYSYYWFPTADTQGAHVKGTGLAYLKTLEILEAHQGSMYWDDKQKASYSFFPNQHIFEYLFIENAQSFEAKLRLTKEMISEDSQAGD